MNSTQTAESHYWNKPGCWVYSRLKCAAAAVFAVAIFKVATEFLKIARVTILIEFKKRFCATKSPTRCSWWGTRHVLRSTTVVQKYRWNFRTLLNDAKWMLRPDFGPVDDRQLSHMVGYMLILAVLWVESAGGIWRSQGLGQKMVFKHRWLMQTLTRIQHWIGVFLGGVVVVGWYRCSFPPHDYVGNLSRMLLLIHVFHPGAVLNSVFKGLGKPCYFESPSGNLWYPVVKPECTCVVHFPTVGSAGTAWEVCTGSGDVPFWELRPCVRNCSGLLRLIMFQVFSAPMRSMVVSGTDVTHRSGQNRLRSSFSSSLWSA